MSRNRRPTTLLLFGLSLATAIVTAIFVDRTMLIPEWGHWYSEHLPHRMQTEAMLQGDLRLRPTPYYHFHDAAWANGLQQIWGLGVPLLRLPFEALAKLLGFAAFPDRIVILLLLVSVIGLLGYALRAAYPMGRKSGHWLDYALRVIPILSLAFLSRPLLELTRARFYALEEVISVAILWEVGVLALLILLTARPSRPIYLATCAVAAFSPWIRITHLAYSAAAIGLAMVIHRSERQLVKLAGPLLLVLSVALIGWSNLDRFGSPTEFGHRLLLTEQPYMKYALTFDDYPFLGASTLDAARELAGAMFTGTQFTNLDFFAKSIHAGQSDIARHREYYFPTFQELDLVLLLLAWLVILGVWARSPRPRKTNVTQMIATWSLISFVPPFFFYMRFSLISSRYVMDFYPAIIGASIALYLFVQDLGARWLPRGIAIIAGMALATLVLVRGASGISQLGTAATYFLSPPQPFSTLAGYYPNGKWPTVVGDVPPLPQAYQCGNTPPPQLAFGILGWSPTDCRVGAATTFLMHHSRCLRLVVELDQLTTDIQSIRVRRGLEHLELEDLRDTGKVKLLTFCAKARDSGKPGLDPDDPDYEQIKSADLFSIGWSAETQFDYDWRPPFKLHMVAGQE